MRYLSGLVVLIVGLTSTIVAAVALAPNNNVAINQNPAVSATLLNVRQPKDVSAAHVGDTHGSKLNRRAALLLFHLVQYHLYQRTVRDRGDRVLPAPSYEESFHTVEIKINQETGTASGITYGDAIYGIQSMMYQMLFPKTPDDNFRQGKWGIVRHTLPKKESVVAIVDVTKILGSTNQTLLDLPANISSPTTSSPMELDSSSPKPLLAPFPVPGTDVTLLIGARGTDLPDEAVIWPLNFFFSEAWQKAAAQDPTPVGQVAIQDDTKRVKVLLRPRRLGTLSLISSTDLAQATMGVVYYFLEQKEFYATTITVVRPDGAGRRTPVADIEIRDQLAGVGTEGGNTSAAEES